MHKLEKIWLFIGTGALVVFLTILGVSAFRFGTEPATGHKPIDPTKITETPPFDNPGVEKLPDGSYQVHVIARAFSYEPNKIQVPAGEKITFHVASADVTHSFTIVDTRVNLEVVPGTMIEKEYTFKKKGKYLVICNEYCGGAHQIMSMEIEVV
ncbi:MAG: cytochrome c oxidase subunit II [Bacilli bacterium]